MHTHTHALITHTCTHTLMHSSHTHAHTHSCTHHTHMHTHTHALITHTCTHTLMHSSHTCTYTPGVVKMLMTSLCHSITKLSMGTRYGACLLLRPRCKHMFLQMHSIMVVTCHHYGPNSTTSLSMHIGNAQGVGTLQHVHVRVVRWH